MMYRCAIFYLLCVVFVFCTASFSSAQIIEADDMPLMSDGETLATPETLDLSEMTADKGYTYWDEQRDLLVDANSKLTDMQRQRDMLQNSLNDAKALIKLNDPLGSLPESGLKAVISDNNLDTVNLLEQTIYEVESQMFLQTRVVQQHAENHNHVLTEWDKLDDGEVNSSVKKLAGESIAVAEVPSDYARVVLTDPPVYAENAVDENGDPITIACPACGEQVTPPTNQTTELPGFIGETIDGKTTYQLGDTVYVTEKVYRGHEVFCSETRYSSGNACNSMYYSCPSPFPGTATVCPQTPDHLKNNCGHDYPEGDPGDHGRRVVCGTSRGVSRLNASGKRVQDTCQVLVWACDRHEHGEHTFTELELSLGSVSEGYMCANASCVYTDSESNGSNSSSSAYPVGGSEGYQRALSARAYAALDWNHRVSLGILAVPEVSPAPQLSYEHQQECVGGHTYWSCDVSELMLHGSRVCPTSGCGQTYSDCLNTSTSCVVGGYHASAALIETLALVSIIADDSVCVL